MNSKEASYRSLVEITAAGARPDTPWEGGRSSMENSHYRIAPPSCSQQSLTAASMATLRSSFARLGHNPSAEMWIALEAVADTMEKMADGLCDESIFLSSLDPGIGKTTTVVAFLKSLIASPRHRHVGVMVCVQRREQIRTITGEASINERDFAVLTSDPDLNKLGSGNPQTARVLFTTHAMIETRCRDSSFAEIRPFHFRGKPRQVRIWDETILPGQALTIPRDAVAKLFEPFRARHPGLAADLEDLFQTLSTIEDGSAYLLPNLATKHGVDLNEALQVVDGQTRETACVGALWFLFGRHVTIRRDGRYGETLLDYKETLPDDIKPVLVLDASARVRATYDFWKQGRGGIHLLPEATKRYDNLTIGVWNQAGGKSGFRKSGGLLVEGIASTINTRPQEPWLVVHHKTGIDMDFEAEVRQLLPPGIGVHFITWGAHDATNDYAGVPNVILAGTLFYRPAYYEALGRAAAGRPSSEGSFHDHELKAVMIGEHRHLILQALCRGSVRRCDGDGCPETRAFIIASARSGINEELPRIFPGARVVPWRPVKTALTGKIGEGLSFIKAKLDGDQSAFVTFKDVMQAIAWTDRREFKKRIRRHDKFVQALLDEGITEWPLGRRPRGFRRRP